MSGKKIMLITGASRGIGKEIAIKASNEGIDIGIIYSKSDEAAGDVISLLVNNGVRACAYKCDLNDCSQIKQAFDMFIKEFRHVDILINNAGITKPTPFLDMSLREWDEVINVNLKGPFYLAQLCAKQMILNRWGRIINIGSIGGERLIPGVSAHYAASKAGLSGLTRAMAKELARYNILVNCVAPGLIETDLSNYMNSRNREEFNKMHPLKRMGRTKEVADLVMFLVSEKSSYITGESMIVSGGLV